MKEVDTLFAGGHTPDGKMCVMEAAAYVAGLPWSDHPECVSQIIAGFLRNWNDRLLTDEERTRLLAPLIPEVLGTAGSEESEMRRSWMAFDWLARECGPTFMDLSESLKPHAKALRDLPPTYDKASLAASMPVLKAAREASSAAWAAAWAAARDALAPSVLALQNSAVDLVKRMAEVERTDFAIQRALKINGYTFEAAQ